MEGLPGVQQLLADLEGVEHHCNVYDDAFLRSYRFIEFRRQPVHGRVNLLTVHMPHGQSNWIVRVQL